MLRTGQRFTMDGHAFRVAYVNDSRAHCIAREPTTVTIHERTFRAHRSIEIDISPSSGVDVLQELQQHA